MSLLLRAARASIGESGTEATELNKLIIAAGMRRSGSTLQYQMLKDVLIASGVPYKALLVPQLAAADLDTSDTSEGVLLIKTHRVPAISAAQFDEVGAAVFYSSRDPRDCVTSYLRKYDRSPTPARACAFLETLRQEFDFWSSRPIAHWTRYEPALADPASEVLGLARALDCALDPCEVASIVQKRSLDAQRELIASIDWQSGAMERGDDRVDPDSLLHSNHIHQGEVEGWRRELPHEVVVSLEQQFGDFIRRAGYELSTGALERVRVRIARRLGRLVRGATG